MKVQAWIATNKVGSQVSWTVDIEDEDLEGLDKTERDNMIDEYVKDELQNHMEWGWKPE